jgi:hypothetical protein
MLKAKKGYIGAVVDEELLDKIWAYAFYREKSIAHVARALLESGVRQLYSTIPAADLEWIQKAVQEMRTNIRNNRGFRE